MFKKSLVGLLIGGVIIVTTGIIVYHRGSFSKTFVLVSQKPENR